MDKIINMEDDELNKNQEKIVKILQETLEKLDFH